MNILCKNKYLKCLLLHISFLFLQINSQELTLTPKESIEQKFNQTISSYNETQLKYDEISKKMSKIKFNFLLKIRYKNMRSKIGTITKEISNLQDQINKERYDQGVERLIDSINNKIIKFNNYCQKTNEVFENFEIFNRNFVEFLKILIVTFITIVVTAMILIGVITLFVIKRQKKYYQLQEEYSISVGQRDSLSKANLKRMKNKEVIDIDGPKTSQGKIKITDRNVFNKEPKSKDGINDNDSKKNE